MQDILETLTRGGVQDRLYALGPRRLLRSGDQARRIKGMDDVADGLHTTAHQRRNRLRRQPAGTRQHNLGTTQTEGIGGTPSRFSLQAFIIGQGSNRERWFHDLSVPWEAQLHNYSCGNALGVSNKGRT
jgi:hypothetical protein